ncbi:LIM domain-containing protein ajuba-like [Nannospalax galili]|uniref:LIM domain-containing protein ajuba-like n=1 Tax=Nannospalax galili TaxID=1026970 RepID=UPI00111BF11A|nr:LIM domain-containing protein ajuba-like [Nannospalax galili]
MCVPNQRKTQTAPASSRLSTGENPKGPLCLTLTCQGSGDAEALGTRSQIAPVGAPEGADSCYRRIANREPRDPAGPVGSGGRGQPPPGGSYLALTGPRLGHPRGTRRSEARSAPGCLEPGRSVATALALHGAPGPARDLEACPVGRDSSGSSCSPRAPAFPCPASVCPSSPAALFPRLCPTGQTGFSAPGRSLWSSSSSSRRRRARLADGAGAGAGGGSAVCPPSYPPGGGEGLDSKAWGWPTRLGSRAAPSHSPRGWWPPLTVTDLSLACDPAAAVAPCSRGVPAPRPRSRYPNSEPPRQFPALCLLGRSQREVGDLASPKSWRGC